MEKLFALIEELSPAYVQFWKEICEIETPSHDKAAVDNFARFLNSKGVNATVRRRLGSDINASCGQLRRESQR